MLLPTVEDLEMNLRETLVVKAEVLMLTVGGELGLNMAAQLTGETFADGDLPTDRYDLQNLPSIAVEHLSIFETIRGLHRYIDSRSFGYSPGDGYIDRYYIQQNYLDFLELYLSALPEMTYGGFDWGPCRHGALRELLKCGQAWHNFICVLDEALDDDLVQDYLTATDLALIAQIEVRSIRNLIGPRKQLRSHDQTKMRKTSVSERGFSVVNSFDAFNWLAGRKTNPFPLLNRGLIAEKLSMIENNGNRARAALLSSFVLGKTREDISRELGVGVEVLFRAEDGTSDDGLSLAIAEYAASLDWERTPRTAPT